MGTCAYRPVTVNTMGICAYRPVTVNTVGACAYRPVTVNTVDNSFSRHFRAVQKYCNSGVFVGTVFIQHQPEFLFVLYTHITV
jgi:hypothetical protein